MNFYFYYPPFFDSPIGGLKHIRLMIKLLNELGTKAFLLPHGVIRDEPYYDLPVPQTSFNFTEAPERLKDDDILVIPEAFQDILLSLKNFRCRKAVYNQNGFYALASFPRGGYERLGVEFVMANSPYVASLTSEVLKFPRERIFTIPYWVAREPFLNSALPSSSRQLGICYMLRKLPFLVAHVRNEVRKYEPEIPWVVIYQIPEKEVSSRLHANRIFFSAQDNEGFGLPALEAMVGGCLVTGFPGTGDFPHPYASSENGLWAPDRCRGLAVEQVLRAIRIAREGGAELDRFLAAGRQTAQAYGQENTLTALTEMLRVVRSGDYQSRHSKIKPLDPKAKAFAHRLLHEYGTRINLNGTAGLREKIKKNLPSPLIPWLRKAKNLPTEFAFKLCKNIPPIKRLLFDFYCQEMEKPQTRRKFFLRLPSKIKRSFYGLGFLPYKINGVWLELNPASFFDRKVISGLEHDPVISKLIDRYLKQGGVFIDVGANIGYFSILAAQRPKTRVFSFEPSPRELFRFYRNVRLNKAGNMTVFPAGLADKEGVRPLYVSGWGNPGLNSVVVKAGPPSECHFAPLDHFLSQSILGSVRICKIDVEGFEMAVLKGMEKSMEFMKEAVFVVEIEDRKLAKAGHQPSDIYAFFETHGYAPTFGFEKLKDLVEYTDFNEIFSKNRIDFPELK